MPHASFATISHLFILSNRVLAALSKHLPGVLLSGVLAGAGMALGGVGWLQSHGLSALTLAILLGMLLDNTVYARLAAQCGAGVNCSKQQLLRLGIILYGLRLTLQDIGHVGLAGVVIDALVLGSTFTLSYVLSTRWLKLEPKAAMLIGAGSSICGAAAVMATEPVLRARAEQVTMAVATVVFNSFQWLPRPVMDLATDLDTVLLAMAMAALGLTTHGSAIRKARLKPLLLALMLFVWLVVGGAFINHWVHLFL